MEYCRSFILFCQGVLKRIYWLIPAFVTDPFDVLDRLGVYMNVPPAISWSLVVLGFLVAIILTYHEQRMLGQRVTVGANHLTLTPRNQLTLSETYVLSDLVSQMQTRHGYDDHNAIELLLRKNIPADEIMNGNCSICGKPRNKRGDLNVHI